MSARRTSGITFDVIKDTYFGCFKKYFVIKGRARRREFWIFFFVNLVLGFIPFINFVIVLLTFIPGFTVGVRRLHDINRSGKWLLLVFIPLVCIIILSIFLFTGLFKGNIRIDYMWFIIPIFIISILILIILLVWSVKEGTRGKNKYGPDPKARK